MKKIKLFILILLISTLCEAQCDRTTDSLTLVDLYNSTNGENWIYKWSLDQPISSWYGVSLNSEGCVQCIDLDGLVACSGSSFNNLGNNLIGSIPESIGNLSQVEFISLGNNFLTGTIPSSFSQLENLEALILRYNGLTGSIPPELGNLDNLENLNLTSNELSGEVPEEIGFMDQLRS